MKKVKYIAFLLVLFIIPFSVSAEETIDEIFDRVAPNGKVTVKSVKPVVVSDHGWDHNNSMELLTAYFQNLVNSDKYDVYADCGYDAVLSDCTLQIGDDSRIIDITWDEPTDKVELITSYLNAVNRGTEDENGEDDLSKYYTIEDLSLINYYKTSDKSEFWNPGAPSRAINFAKEVSKILDNSDVSFTMMVGMGDQDPALMYESAAGAVSVNYNGYTYGNINAGIHARRVIYIPQDTEDTKEAYVFAAQKRINDYLGNNSVKVTYGGRLSDLLDVIPDGSDYSKDQILYEGSPNERPIAYTDLLDSTVPENQTDGNYYNVKVGNITYKFYIIKGDASKLVEPVYKAKNIDTKIVITSTDSSIPLDTSISAKVVNFEDIKELLDTDNFISYNIALFSSAKNTLIEELDNGKFLVTIPVPDDLKGKTLTVYYLTTENKLEEHEVTVNEDGTITFETNHFSTYTIAEKIAATNTEQNNNSNTNTENTQTTTDKTEEKEEVVKDTTTTQTSNPKTGDNVMIYVSILVICVVGISGIFIYKKVSKK